MNLRKDHLRIFITTEKSISYTVVYVLSGNISVGFNVLAMNRSDGEALKNAAKCERKMKVRHVVK